MEKIKKYIVRFLKSKPIRQGYDMSCKEWITLVDLAICSTSDAVDAIGTTFNFGYAKGYRAAMAEIKKGGTA